VKICLVSPYDLSLPGGVNKHVRSLAERLLAKGDEVEVIGPATSTDRLGPHVTGFRGVVSIHANNSDNRIGLFTSPAAVARYMRRGAFDVVHVHEPAPPSLSLLACMIHDGPLVATFHAATVRSRFLAMFDAVLQPFLEKLSGRIAVSAAARKVIVEHLGADAVVIPNGVAVAHYANATPLDGYPRDGATIGFIGRYDEPRKGMDVLVRAVEQMIGDRPDLRVLVAGRGEAADFLAELPKGVAERIDILGQVSEADKARMLHSVDVYCAPNTGQESFGVILLEAMAAGTAVVASDLEAFRRVLAGGAAGELFAVGDSGALAAALGRVLDDPARRRQLIAAGAEAVAPFDWSLIVGQVVRVYELAIAGAGVPLR
jgi:phosphatidylinositol alpha-mannosyltransferase